ncbi:MAG: SOS response-associated peptidase family protein [Desulfotomaculum sp.]|nr:SOS response-associated peptidase family protein [Desulfotomaculum sp.]
MWDKWVSKNGEEMLTFSIITTGANDCVKDIHDNSNIIYEQQSFDFYHDKLQCFQDISDKT